MSPPHLDRHTAALLGAISTMLTACAERPATNDTGSSPTISAAPESAATVAPAPSIEPTPLSSSRTDPEVFAPAPSTTEGGASGAPTKPPPPPPPPPPPKPPKKPKGWVEGRPFLVHGVARLAGTENANGWAEPIDAEDHPASAAQRSALIDHFTKWSLAEHASVASFSRFTLQLMALGAPADLITRSVAAAADEVRHARFGFALASLVAGHPIAPTQLSMQDALGEVSLEQTLRLAVREGMIGETIAALEAHVSAEVTTLPRLARLLTSIAEDESRHAELAYAFGAWALARAPHLSSVVAEEIAAWQAPVAPGRPGLETWGVLDASARARIHDTGLDEVVRPLIAQLLQNGAAHCARTVQAPT